MDETFSLGPFIQGLRLLRRWDEGSDHNHQVVGRSGGQ